MSELPIFAYCSPDQQGAQLRAYFKSLGCDVGDQSLGEEKDALDLVKECSILAQTMDNEAEIEMLLNSIVSLITAVPSREKLELVASQFCDKLTSPAYISKSPTAVIHVLSNMFHGFSESDKRALQYKIYCSMLKVGHSFVLLEPVLQVIR